MMIKTNETALVVEEKDPLIEIQENSTLETAYKKQELVLDIVLLSFSVWAQFGYSLYSQQNAFKSLNDPLARYLYPHINSHLSENILKSIDTLMRVLSISDAIFTTASYFNMRRCRKTFIIEVQGAFKKYKSTGNLPIFIANGFLMWSFFIISSFSPWTGFSRSWHNHSLCDLAGSTMWIGLMISYLMSYAPYTFSAPEKIISFYNLQNKKDIFYCIFLTRKGLLEFLPRAIVSVVNRSWVLYGSSLLTLEWIFKTKNPFIGYSFSILSVIATAHQTLMSQVIKDYSLTFNNGRETQNSDRGNAINQNKQPIIYNIALFILSISVFLLRTFSVPSLYTGEIHDPGDNYTSKDSVLSLLGLLCGGYSAFQYVRFRRNRYQDNFSAWFKEKNGLRAQEATAKQNNGDAETPNSRP